jgi:hypothetical protein
LSKTAKSSNREDHPSTSRSGTSHPNASFPKKLETSVASSNETIEEFAATNIDDALDLLSAVTQESDKISVEKHPEKRVKHAWLSYLEENLPRVRQEHPELRYHNHIELLKKEWKKSPQNPMNQVHVAYNATIKQKTEVVEEHIKITLDQLKLHDNRNVEFQDS